MRCLDNELSDFRVGAYRLYKNNLARVEIHAVRLVHFLASLDERTLDLFRLRVGLTHDIEHIGQDRMRTAIVLKMTEIHSKAAR